MPYYLMRHGTGLRSTHINIVNLIVLIIETGILTGRDNVIAFHSRRLTHTLAAIAILHFCLYFIKTTAFVIPGLTISKVYGNTMLVILNNRIARRLHTEESEDLDLLPRSPGRRSFNGGPVYTMPSARQTTSRAGGSSIIVTKDRLIFRLDPDMHPPPLPRQSMSDGDTRSAKESVHSSNPVYVSPVFEFSLMELIFLYMDRDMLSVRKKISQYYCYDVP
jgi:hypothetical protein